MEFGLSLEQRQFDDSLREFLKDRLPMERLRALTGWKRLACRTRLEGDVKVFTMPGAHERTRRQRPVSPPPRPTDDPTAARKPDDASSGAAFLYGHPAAVASGTRKPPEKKAATTADAAEKDEAAGDEGG